MLWLALFVFLCIWFSLPWWVVVLLVVLWLATDDLGPSVLAAVLIGVLKA